MTDRAALLATIAADPADEVARLVYADWLDEHGDADRAEFIRVQCDLAAGAGVRQSALAEREFALLAKHGAAWRVAGLTGRQRFARGFVETIETTADSLLAAGPDAFIGVPVRTLRLVAADRLVEDLIPLPVWRTVETLVLNNNSFGTQGRLGLFLGGADLPRLTALSLRNNQVWPWGVQALAAVPVTARLKRLDLSGNPIADAGADWLASQPGFAGLEELILRSDEIPFADCVHAVGAAAVAASQTLTHLRTLSFADQYLGDAGLTGLVRSPNARRLTDLDLSYNGIGALGSTSIERLTESPYLRRLKRLNLDGNRLDRPAIDALLNWPRLASLSCINLTDCEMDGKSTDAIRASPFADKFVLSD